MKEIQGRFLVRNGRPNDNTLHAYPILKSHIPLSFWGGIDPVTAVVIDQSHPLVGKCVTDTILCLPSGRGSCTASQVLLELVLNGIAPRAIVLRDEDAMVCIGAIVAQEIFDIPTLDVIHVGDDGYNQLLLDNESEAFLLQNGIISLGSDFTSQLHEFETQSASIDDIDLTDDEKRILDQSITEAQQMALRVIFRYAKILNPTPSYLPISSAHIDGCTYIGPGGLRFVQHLVANGGKVQVPTTLNSVSADRKRWKHFGVPKDYAMNSIALGDAYLALGCQPSFTCAPYLLANPPTVGQHVAWGESNAVVFANSVLGARTEKYADYLECCCAIAGFVPEAGVHVDNNRRPGIILDGTDVFATLRKGTETNDIEGLDVLFPTLGHLCGTLSDGRVPLVIGLENWNDIVSVDNLKAFCAAFGTTGSSPLVHIAGITPEATDMSVVNEFVQGCRSTQVITLSQLDETFNLLDARSDGQNSVELVALGNPHLSVTECKEIARLIQAAPSPTVKSVNTRIMACMSRTVHQSVDPDDEKVMTDFGIEFVFDTCWCMLLDEPIIPSNISATILTNSGKYAHYGPGLTQRHFRYGSMNDCINAARLGHYPKRNNNWLASQSRLLSVIVNRPTIANDSIGTALKLARFVVR